MEKSNSNIDKKKRYKFLYSELPYFEGAINRLLYKQQECAMYDELPEYLNLSDNITNFDNSDINLMFEGAIKLSQLARDFVKSSRTQSVTITSLCDNYKLVIDYNQYLPIIKSVDDCSYISEVLADLREHYISYLGEDYLKREKVVNDINEILAAVQFDIQNLSDLEELRDVICDFILTHSEIIDFTKAYQYVQTNNKVKDLKK